MISNYIIEQLRNRFINQQYITREELYKFLKTFDPELKESTFGWKIYDLKTKGIIISPKRSIYSLHIKKVYKPMISENMKKIAKKLIKDFPFIKYCMMDTEWLNEFTIHQFARTFIIVEVQSDIVKAVFHRLKDSSPYDVFIEPKPNVINNYLQESDKPLVVIPMITQSPIIKLKGMNIPRLEKILVDIFLNSYLYYLYDGSERKNIVNHAHKYYNLNITTLISYVKKRKSKKKVRQFLNLNFANIIK